MPGDPGRGQEDAMADHVELEYATATGNDYPVHEHTYRAFVALVKTAIILVAIILLIMGYFLT
jgi:Bacterial aa3 type cytochrome c oxidase subunit IV